MKGRYFKENDTNALNTFVKKFKVKILSLKHKKIFST